mgnify:CR=1 FL=1
MTCVFIIAGREAIPVRAIPLVDGWRSFTPDEVARGLAHRNESGKLEGLTAYHIASDGSISAMLPKEWDAVVDALDELSTTLNEAGQSRSVWRERSIRELPSRCFVWRDEFERCAARWWRMVHIVGERPGDKALNFAPRIPPTLEDAVFEGVPKGNAASRPAMPESELKVHSGPAGHDAELAALFDPVRVATLESLFPDGERWAKYAERAIRNGLENARVGRGIFNPYRAARWWLEKQAPAGWKWERCARVLANNLPARSRDCGHLLTGDYD